MLPIQPKLAATTAAEYLGITIQAIHKKLKSEDIVLPKIGNKAYITHEIGQKLFNIDFSPKKIAFQIVKGGTGKTTSLHNVACAASLYGAKVLLVDIDPQGNLTDSFNVSAEQAPVVVDILSGDATAADAVINAFPGIDIIPSRIENVVLDTKLNAERVGLHYFFGNMLKEIEDQYDFILIDCPPMISSAVTAATLYSDLVLVPLNPDKFSAKGLEILRGEIKNIKKHYQIPTNYKVFLNKYSSNTILSDKAIQTIIAEETAQGNALETAIRLAQEIPNITDGSKNLFSSLKKSTAREDFDLLTKELLEIDLSKTSNKGNATAKPEAITA